MACIFCQIASGEVPSEILYQDDKAFAIRDINPQAPTHILIMPKAHITSLADMTEGQLPLLAHMVRVANEMAKREGIDKRGYRLTINCRAEGGQVVPHLHMHLLGGRRLSGRLG